MDRLIYTAMTGASQVFSRQAAVANNLANVSTSGYRAEEHRLRAVQVQSRSAQLPTRAFAADASTHTDFSPGAQMFTGRPFDLVVQGQGWFAVQTADGKEAYTRDGGFEVDPNGVLRNRAGLAVQGDGGMITVPPDVRVSVGRDGTVSTVQENGARNSVSVIGRVKLVNPPETDLARGEDGLFRTRNGLPAEINDQVRIAEGYIEGSNVNVSEQIVDMISLARQFEMQMKMLSTADSNDQAATKILASQ